MNDFEFSFDFEVVVRRHITKAMSSFDRRILAKGCLTKHLQITTSFCNAMAGAYEGNVVYLQSSSLEVGISV